MWSAELDNVISISHGCVAQVAKIRSKFGMKLEAGKRVEPQEFEQLGPHSRL